MSNCHDKPETLEEKIRAAGGEAAIFVDRDGQLRVIDLNTGEEPDHFVDEHHPHHPARIVTRWENGEDVPTLVEKHPNEHGEDVPITPPRLLAERKIYFWRYTGSTCICIWSGGRHIVIG